MQTVGDAYDTLAYAYDKATGEASAARLTVFLERVLARYSSQQRTHLDLACGTGLEVRFFQRLGYRSIGLDASLPMLRLARRRAERRVAADLRALPLRATFGTITLLNDAVSSLRSRSELLQCFRAIRRCMDRRSFLLFDISTPRTMSLWPEEKVRRTRGRSHALSIRAEYSRSRRLATLQFDGWAMNGGCRYAISEIHYLRAYTQTEILHSLGRAALKPLEVLDFRRYANNDAWLFVVSAY